MLSGRRIRYPGEPHLNTFCKASITGQFNLSYSPACSSLVLDEVGKQSTCELEVDAVAVDILNRLEIESKTNDYGLSGCCLHECISSF